MRQQPRQQATRHARRPQPSGLADRCSITRSHLPPTPGGNHRPLGARRPRLRSCSLLRPMVAAVRPFLYAIRISLLTGGGTFRPCNQSRLPSAACPKHLRVQCFVARFRITTLACVWSGCKLLAQAPLSHCPGRHRHRHTQTDGVAEQGSVAQVGRALAGWRVWRGWRSSQSRHGPEPVRFDAARAARAGPM